MIEVENTKTMYYVPLKMKSRTGVLVCERSNTDGTKVEVIACMSHFVVNTTHKDGSKSTTAYQPSQSLSDDFHHERISFVFNGQEHNIVPMYV